MNVSQPSLSEKKRRAQRTGCNIRPVMRVCTARYPRACATLFTFDDNHRLLLSLVLYIPDAVARARVGKQFNPA